MKVQAAQGTRCPMEGQPGKYISDAKPVDAPNTAYYRRLVREGSLVPATEPPSKKRGLKAVPRTQPPEKE